MLAFSITFLKLCPAICQDSLKFDIIDYLIKVGDLAPVDNRERYIDNIFIVELLKHDDIGNNKKGIFKFGAYADHVNRYLLLKNNKECQILTLEKLDEDLLKELSYLKQNRTSPNEILKYIEATIIVYQKNLKAVPWIDKK